MDQNNSIPGFQGLASPQVSLLKYDKRVVSFHCTKNGKKNAPISQLLNVNVFKLVDDRILNF